jgi:hypothetical protein
MTITKRIKVSIIPTNDLSFFFRLVLGPGGAKVELIWLLPQYNTGQRLIVVILFQRYSWDVLS